MTTREPGARLVLTHGFVRRPRLMAFRASRPAATITEGFEVLVHEVIAAITTEPSCSIASWFAVERRGHADVPVAEDTVEARRDVGDRDAILRPARPGQARDDGREVELLQHVERRHLVAVAPEQALGLRVAVDELGGIAAPRCAEVAERLVVDREERRGRAVLGTHVRERGAIGEREGREPVAAELDERADDAALAQQLGQGEHEVGRRHAGVERAREADADDARGTEHERLAEHHGLGLDAADTEPEDAEPVDHGGVRVGADERVGDREAAVLAQLDDAAEVLEVDLVDDAHARRHDAEAVERALRPAQQLVALAVPLVLAVDVAGVGELAAERVDLDGVVDHEVARHERVDARGVAACARHRGAHGGEVDDRGHAREVLQDDAGGMERHGRAVRWVLGVAGERLDVGLADVLSAGMAQQVLEQDLDGVGQPREIADSEFGEALEANEVGSAPGKGGSRAVGIVGHARTIAIVRPDGRRPPRRARDQRARTACARRRRRLRAR